LASQASKQEEHIQQGSPLASFVELRNTYARASEVAGWPNSEIFWKQWGQEEQQQMEQQQAQRPPEPTPEERLEKIEMAKIEQRQQEAMLDARMQARDQDSRIVAARIQQGQKVEQAEIDRQLSEGELMLKAADQRLKREIAEVETVTKARDTE